MAVYRHTAIVRFRFGFPIDMLRYDSCYPKTEQDAGAIERSVGDVGAASGEVRVEKIDDRKKPIWTVDRWKSFGCEIELEETQRAY